MPAICAECGGSFDDVGSPEHELSTARTTIAELTTRVDVLDAELRETREALRALLRFEPDDLADRLKPDRQAWWTARRVVATGLDTQWAQRTYASPLPDADWTLCAADIVQAQLSVSLSRHVPGWPGATDEQLAAVAREIVNALDQGRDGPGKPQNR